MKRLVRRLAVLAVVMPAVAAFADGPIIIINCDPFPVGEICTPNYTTLTCDCAPVAPVCGDNKNHEGHTDDHDNGKHLGCGVLNHQDR